MTDTVAVLGSGDVGQRLATGFAKKGHKVMMGTRDPRKEDVQAWLKEAGPNASAGTNAEAAKFGEVVVLATNWAGTENALRLAGAENLRGKLLLDVTNPLDFSSGGPALALGHKDSGGEQVQRWVPEAKVVKTLNMVTNAHMVDPDVPGGNPTILYCGDDAAAKAKALAILRELGHEDPADFGGIEAARHLEALAMVWIVYGVRTNHWAHAIRIVNR